MSLALIIAGAACVYFLFNFLYRRYWDRGLSADIEFDRKSVVRGEKANLIETITNQKILPLSMVKLKFQIDRSMKFTDSENTTAVSDKCYKSDVFSMLFYQKITRTLSFECTRRGCYTVENIDLVSANLFLNSQYVKSVPAYAQIMVYPRLSDMSRLDIPYSKIMGECMSKRYIYEDPFEFRGIREYQPHDTLSSVNWKATAKTGELKVNVHNYTSSQEVCIMLNLDSETDWEDDAIKEECISIAAGLCEMLIRAGVSVSFVTNGCDRNKKRFVLDGGLSAAHVDMVLSGLARIDLSQNTEPFTEIIDEYIDMKIHGGMFVMVSFATSQKLHEKYDKLCENNKGSMWIIPYTKKNYNEVDECKHAQIYRWEVTANDW